MEKREAGAMLLYGPEERPESLKDILVYSLQWLFIMFYPVVWGYAIVGVSVDFTADELSAYMSRVVLMIGLSTLIHVLAGHKLAMVSGPSIIPSLAIVAAFSIGGKEYALQSFNAYIFAGLVVAVLGALGVIGTISKVWSPLVQGAMLLMIGLATSLTGMSMIARDGASWPYYAGILLALLCGWLSIKGKGMFSTIPVMITIALGYIIFILGGRFDWSLVEAMPVLAVPTIFPYGFQFPPIDLIVVMTIINLFSAINLYGNMRGFTGLLGSDLTKKDERRSLAVFGLVDGVLTGILGVPSHVALGENMGFLLLTKIASKFLLLIASVAFIVLSFFGKVGGFMAAMPEPVAGAVLLGVASTLIGIGINAAKEAPTFSTREIFIVGFAIFFSLGTMTLPGEFFTGLPRLAATLLSNPVILVILLVIILERVVFRVDAEKASL